MSHPAALSTGRFVWHEILTPDLPRSVKFYSSLFAWKIIEAKPAGPGKCARIELAGRPIGGMLTYDPGPEKNSQWLGYVTVDRVEAAVHRAGLAGGTGSQPLTVRTGLGRFSKVRDPYGATFCTIQVLQPPAPETEEAPHGAFCWDELLTPDPTRAVAFYRDTIGWGHKTLDMGNAGTYWLFTSGHRERAGMVQSEPGTPTLWLPYILVRDVDKAAVEIRELGGEILDSPHDIQKIGRFAIAADPTGAMFAVFAPETAA